MPTNSEKIGDVPYPDSSGSGGLTRSAFRCVSRSVVSLSSSCSYSFLSIGVHKLALDKFPLFNLKGEEPLVTAPR